MKPVFDGVVESEILTQIRRETWPKGSRRMLIDLAAVEPILSRAVQNMIRNTLKLLDGYGVPVTVVSSMEDLLIAVAVNAILGVQQGHLLLWRDPELERRLGLSASTEDGKGNGEG